MISKAFDHLVELAEVELCGECDLVTNDGSPDEPSAGGGAASRSLPTTYQAASSQAEDLVSHGAAVVPASLLKSMLRLVSESPPYRLSANVHARAQTEREERQT